MTARDICKVSDELMFPCGSKMKNRFSLAPMTNCQSHDDGTLSYDELHWLEMRAKGGFGMTMTCASHVQEIGKGFPGQLGIWSDRHMEGHRHLATAIKKHNSLAVIQLHHAGLRTPRELVDKAPVSPSSMEKYGSRGLSTEEVEQLRDDFIRAAERAYECGYDGVEVHGAHGYIISQFISSKYNFRTDQYGGDLEGRSRLLFEIMDGIRVTCGSNFLVGIRLSPERYGMDIDEIKWIIRKLVSRENTDFIDVSLWDCFKMPHDEKYQDKSLLDHFLELDYGKVKLSVAGHITSSDEVHALMNRGVAFLAIGKAAILHHDFPVKVMEDDDFVMESLPVDEAYLKDEGLSPKFIEYMGRWDNFVKK